MAEPNKCPECDSTNINYMEDPIYCWWLCYCNDCNHEWREY